MKKVIKQVLLIAVLTILYSKTNAQFYAPKQNLSNNNYLGIGDFPSQQPQAPLHILTNSLQPTIRLSCSSIMSGRSTYTSYNDFDIICKIGSTGGEGPNPYPIIQFKNSKSTSNENPKSDCITMGEVSIAGFTAKSFILDANANTFVPSSSGMYTAPFGISLNASNMVIGKSSTVTGPIGLVLNSDGALVNTVQIGTSTLPKRLKIFGTGSSGTNGSDDATLTLWQSANVVMHLDGNDVWSEDNLFLNDYSDKNIYLCPKANGVGKVGIGTNIVPSDYRMTVNGKMSANFISIDATKAVAWGYGQQITVTNNDTKAFSIANTAANTEPITFYGDGSLAIDGPVFKVDRSGRVAIGSVGPFPSGYNLAVNGAMICTKIVARPYSIWPDYVFKKDYKLQSLPEVERYIATHGHLQDMPTAQEVQQQGVDVGEMNRLLLQKVEELTLQLIQLNKTVEQLKKDVKK